MAMLMIIIFIKNENDGNHILSIYGSHRNTMTVSLPEGTILEEDR